MQDYETSLYQPVCIAHLDNYQQKHMYLFKLGKRACIKGGYQLQDMAAVVLIILPLKLFLGCHLWFCTFFTF